MSQDLGQDFLKEYKSVRREDRIFGSGSNTEVPDYLILEQSDVSITSNNTTKVYDYGLGSMSTYKYHESFAVPLNKPATTAVSPNKTMIAKTGEWFEPNDSLAASEVLNADADDLLSSSSKTDSLEVLLHNATLEAKGHLSSEWLPASALYDICQASNVVRELRTEFKLLGEAEQYAEYVCGNSNDPQSDGISGRRIFAILVLISKVKELPRFIDAGLRDEHLPFLWTDDSREALYSEVHSPESPSRLERIPLSCFGKNDKPLMRLFFQMQWQIHVPFFTRGSANEVKAYQLHRNTIMPWTDFIGREKESGFSRVRCIKIHHAHHTFHEHKSFALKTLLQDSPILAAKEFGSELHVFMKMRPEKHLLELLATFEVKHENYNQYSFLFPWAEGGSLEDLWKKQPSNMLPGNTVTPRLLLQWIAEQFHGLAGALNSIHDVRLQALKRTKLEEAKRELDEEYYGIHGDIKPENILHFSQLAGPTALGVLKIADFGLTEFHTLRSRTAEIHGRKNMPTPAPTYQAPELVHTGEYHSRQADIWSLGCVFSQFTTWAVLGAESVKEFDQRRKDEKDYDHKLKADHKFTMDTFYKAELLTDGRVTTSIKKATKEVSTIVWLQNLHEQVGGNKDRNFLTDLCELLSKGMLEPRRGKRIRCEKLVQELGRFVATSGPPDDPYWNPPLQTFIQHQESGSTLSCEPAGPAKHTYSWNRKKKDTGIRRVSFDQNSLSPR